MIDYLKGEKMKAKILLLFIITFSFLSCSEDDGVEPVDFNPNTESFLDGQWSGNGADEDKSISITAQLNAPHDIIGGTITVDFSASIETLGIINIDINGTVSGTLVNSQMSFGAEDANTGNTFLYNGQLAKNDSTRIIGNARVHYAVADTNFMLNLNLSKQ